MSAMGKGRSSESAKTCAARVARILASTYFRLRQKKLSRKKTRSWLYKLIEKQSGLLSVFCSEQLLVLDTVRAQTALSYFDDLFSVVQFELLTQTRKGKKINDLQFNFLIKQLRKSLRKLNRRERSDEKFDIPNLIKEGKWPRGGMRELQELVGRKLEWAWELIERVYSGESICKEDYMSLMQLIFAALYTHSPQGRIAGVMSLRMKQGRELLDKGSTLTDVFKTRASFGFQPVSLDPKVGRKLFDGYFVAVRQFIVKEASLHDTDDTALWLTLEGSPLTTSAGGRMISGFFLEFSLRITSNTCRSIGETEAAMMLQQGTYFIFYKNKIFILFPTRFHFSY